MRGQQYQAVGFADQPDFNRWSACSASQRCCEHLIQRQFSSDKWRLGRQSQVLDLEERPSQPHRRVVRRDASSLYELPVPSARDSAPRSLHPRVGFGEVIPNTKLQS